MAGQSQSVYASAPFKFIVEGKPFYVHADLVSLHSKPLNRMINGRMAEAQSGFATLEDVDQDTFVRYIEWAHKGYYAAAKFTVLAESHMSKTTSSNTNDWNSHARTRSNKREDLIREFISRSSVERKGVAVIPPPRGNQSPNEVYSEVFLSHARVYVFAEKYDIQPLKMLALDELHALLAIYTLYAERIGDIVELLRYVYANTGESREGAEDLRTLMTNFIGLAMDMLIKNPEFGVAMIEDGGDLLNDFMKMVAKRI